jgi:hypothetical protein
MSTYAHTASRPRFGHLRAHLPAYLVGIGATAALTAGALVVFLSLATFVAFNGLPFGGSSDDVGSAYLDPSPSVAPASAATALGAAPGAVANAAAGSSGAGRAGSATAAESGSGGSGSGGAPSGDPAGKAPTEPEPAASTSPGQVAVPLPSTSGPVTNVVQSVDNAAGTNLSGAGGGAAGAVEGAANQAARSAGRTGLGGRAGGAVSGVRDRVLGGAGSAGRLLTP